MKTQAWGWLVAGVLALGFNGLYHDGGLDWAHRIAAVVQHDVQYKADALLAGRAGQILAEAELFSARNETATARIATAVAQAQNRVARSQTGLARLEAMTARQQAACAQLEANRARMEAERARIEAMVQARMAMAAVPVPAAALVPGDITIPVVCPRVKVGVPRTPLVHVPVRMIQVDSAGAGPV